MSLDEAPKRAPDNPVLAALTARALGLLPLWRPRKICHGYQNGCTCGCSSRKRASTPPKQPWEPRA